MNLLSTTNSRSNAGRLCFENNGYIAGSLLVNVLYITFFVRYKNRKLIRNSVVVVFYRLFVRRGWSSIKPVVLSIQSYYYSATARYNAVTLRLLYHLPLSLVVCLTSQLLSLRWRGDQWEKINERGQEEVEIFYLFQPFNGSQLAKMKKSIPDMSLPWNL